MIRKELQTLLETSCPCIGWGYGHYDPALSFTGKRFQRRAVFAKAEKDLKGNNDLLSITRPDVIMEIHKAYLEAGPTSLRPILLVVPG